MVEFRRWLLVFVLSQKYFRKFVFAVAKNDEKADSRSFAKICILRNFRKMSFVITLYCRLVGGNTRVLGEGKAGENNRHKY